MTRCPYCGAEAEDAWAEVSHMNKAHPEIIAQRLTEAGFVLRRDGYWHDTRADTPPLPQRRFTDGSNPIPPRLPPDPGEV